MLACRSEGICCEGSLERSPTSCWRDVGYRAVVCFTAVRSVGREQASKSEDGGVTVMKSVDEAAAVCFGRVRLRRRAGTLRMIGDLATTFFQDVSALLGISCSCVTALSNTIPAGRARVSLTFQTFTDGLSVKTYPINVRMQVVQA